MDSIVTRLGGLPLALVQAGQYMLETGISCRDFLEIYNTSSSVVQAIAPRIPHYANDSLYTTWTISYDRIKHQDTTAAKLLQLWAYLDPQDLWFGLLTRGSCGLKVPDWLHDLGQQELIFKRAMRTLLDYSLIESHQDTGSYSIHRVVHDWCTGSFSRDKLELTRLTLMIVGRAVPEKLEPEHLTMQQRLLPHADRCVEQYYRVEMYDRIDDQDSCDAFNNLGNLYADQSKLVEAEKMYQRALKGYEKAWGPEHTSTRDMFHNLANLYVDQGKPAAAEEMYVLALKGYEKAWGPEHTLTLDKVNILGNLYVDQGELAKAEKMYVRALKGYEKALGSKNTRTLRVANMLSNLYKRNQSKTAEMETALGSEHTSTLDTITCSSEPDLSEISSIASWAGSESSKSSSSSYADDTLVAALDETTELFMGDEELRDLFVKAFDRQNRDKVLRNGARLLKWLGRRLVITAKRPMEKEAAKLFLSQKHDRSIIDRIALKVLEDSSEKGKLGQTAQRQLESSIKQERLEIYLQQRADMPAINLESAPNSNSLVSNEIESETSLDSEDEQQVTEGMEKLNVDAAKSFLKSSDAFARFKEELNDFISPLGSEAMWKKTLWIGEQPVRFELPKTAPQRTYIDKLKSTLEEHLQAPVLWWPLKQPRRHISSNEVRIILPCVSE